MLEQCVVARDEQFNYSSHPYIQALENNAPESWSSLPDLDQKRRSYYQALEDPGREMLGQQQVRREERGKKGSTYKIKMPTSH
jgi:hypothetical protein